jgi:hypothetical protein
MLPAGFETAILASEQPQSHALDRAATAIGTLWTQTKNCMFKNHQIILHLGQALDRHRSSRHTWQGSNVEAATLKIPTRTKTS